MKFIFSAALLLSVASLSQASSLTYSTTGSFSTSGTNTLNLGAGLGTIVFDNLPSTTITVPGNLSYGTFDTTGITSVGEAAMPAGEMFTLTIKETSPDVGNFVNTDTIQGSISTTGSTVNLSFPTTTFTIGGTTYHIAEDPVLGISIVAPDDNNGITTIQGTVATGASPSPIPEPATTALLGAGLLGLALLSRKRV
jgi:hypothetical protein